MKIFKQIENLTVVIVNKKSRDIVTQIRGMYSLKRLCSCSEEEIEKLKGSIQSKQTTIPSTYKEIAGHLKEKYQLI